MAHWCFSNPSPSLVPGWAFRIVIDVDVRSAISFRRRQSVTSLAAVGCISRVQILAYRLEVLLVNARQYQNVRGGGGTYRIVSGCNTCTAWAGAQFLPASASGDWFRSMRAELGPAMATRPHLTNSPALSTPGGIQRKALRSRPSARSATKKSPIGEIGPISGISTGAA
jgi:hypothetical protein